jgi:2-polyprenyl-6-methoxyphenol hydroxylase-like FAD-dependent oxidoreductase
MSRFTPSAPEALMGTDRNLRFGVLALQAGLIDRWAKGRTALVGDAAACVSLMAGEGTGLAMAEAYVLAGELRHCGGDHAAAFTRYRERLMPLL